MFCPRCEKRTKFYKEEKIIKWVVDIPVLYLVCSECGIKFKHYD